MFELVMLGLQSVRLELKNQLCHLVLHNCELLFEIPHPHLLDKDNNSTYVMGFLYGLNQMTLFACDLNGARIK